MRCDAIAFVIRVRLANGGRYPWVDRFLPKGHHTKGDELAKIFRKRMYEWAGCYRWTCTVMNKRSAAGRGGRQTHEPFDFNVCEMVGCLRVLLYVIHATPIYRATKQGGDMRFSPFSRHDFKSIFVGVLLIKRPRGECYVFCAVTILLPFWEIHAAWLAQWDDVLRFV